MDHPFELKRLFALSSPPDTPPPSVSPAYDISSLKFLENIHRKRSEALKEILSTRSWQETISLNPHAESAAFMIVQHADYDPDFQKHCHALMLESAMRGKAQLGFLAFLTDRILCNEGKHQRFGTQIREVLNGCFVPKPIEDPDKVDELRQQVGLTETITDYYQRVNNGDLLLYRPLLNGFAEELEERKATKVVEFPGNKPH